MSPYLIAALVIFALVIGYAGARYAASSTRSPLATGFKADITKVETAVKDDLPDLRADAMAAVTQVETWLTDTTAADAMIAKGTALKAAQASMLATHIATLTAAAQKTATSTAPTAPVA